MSIVLDVLFFNQTELGLFIIKLSNVMSLIECIFVRHWTRNSYMEQNLVGVDMIINTHSLYGRLYCLNDSYRSLLLASSLLPCSIL